MWSGAKKKWYVVGTKGGSRGTMDQCHSTVRRGWPHAHCWVHGSQLCRFGNTYHILRLVMRKLWAWGLGPQLHQCTFCLREGSLACDKGDWSRAWKGLQFAWARLPWLCLLTCGKWDVSVGLRFPFLFGRQPRLCRAWFSGRLQLAFRNQDAMPRHAIPRFT